ncbi:MAG: hypothetical protein WBB01_26565 [Phormidesmis sp.]
MAPQDRKPTFFSVIWNRLKYALSAHPDELPPALPAKPPYRVRYLERCLSKDCLVEENRKRLERSWQAASK